MSESENDAVFQRFKMVVGYCGQHYKGWFFQNHVKTVQGEIEHALAHIFKKEIKIKGVSRTDAGVHAIGQVAHFDAPGIYEADLLKIILNRHLPRDIFVHSLEKVSSDFHCRAQNTGKHYQYRIYLDRSKMLLSKTTWYEFYKYQSIDFDAINREALRLCGTHDFKSLGSASGREDDTVKTVYHVCVHYKPEKYLVFDVVGKSFLYKMVRCMAGTLLHVGLGKIKSVEDVLAQKNRHYAGPNLEARGLCLMKVFYDPSEPLLFSPSIPYQNVLDDPTL